MSELANRVRVFTTTVGTGTVTMGAAFSNAFYTDTEAGMIDGKPYSFVLEDGNDFEDVTGIYTASTHTLTRAVVEGSKIAGVAGTTKLTLSGNATIRVVALAKDYAQPGTHAGGRLTATSGVALTTADVTAATALYYTPAGHDRIGLYDGTSWRQYQFSEMTLSLDSNSGHTGYHQSGKNFSAFIAVSSGALVIGTGPAWSSDTAVGTGAGTSETEVFEGRLVNKVSIALRNGSNTYTIAARCAQMIGGFRATANGQTEDSFAKRFVSNVFNTKPRILKVLEATATWGQTTGSGTIQANSSAANQVDYFHCVPGLPVRVDIQANVTSQSATIAIAIAGIGLDGTSNTPTFQGPVNVDNVHTAAALATYAGYPGIGRHYLVWLTVCIVAAVTWQSSSVSGLVGTVEN